MPRPSCLRGPRVRPRRRGREREPFWSLSPPRTSSGCCRWKAADFGAGPLLPRPGGCHDIEGVGQAELIVQVVLTPQRLLAPDRIAETEHQEGSTSEGWFIRTGGYVGSDVVGVTVHTSSGLDIEASVVDGRFAAWWPAVEQSSDNPDGETWSYTVHLADGSTRRTR